MIRERVAARANLLRLHTAGFEGFVFVAGPMLAGAEASIADLAVLWLLGVLVNGSIFALNDLVDLPRDRLNPTKARSPLVTGTVSEREALLWSLGLPLAALTIVAWRGWPGSAQTAFALVLILGAAVNLYQKATAHPLMMDGLFAVAMASPLPVGALAVSAPLGPELWSATALLLLLSLQLNSVAGNLKDLASDRRTGFRTVAVSMGADITEDGRLAAPPRYRRYCRVLYGTAALSGMASVWLTVRNAPPAIALGCCLVAVAALTGGAVDLGRLVNGRRRPSRRGREWYFAAGFLLLLLAIGARAPAPELLWALAALALWEAVCAIYWSWHWRSSSSTAIGRL